LGTTAGNPEKFSSSWACKEFGMSGMKKLKLRQGANLMSSDGLG